MNWIEVIKQEKRKNAGTWSLCILLTVAVGIIQSFVLVYLLKRIVEVVLRDGYRQIMLLLLFLGMVFLGMVLEILRQGVRFSFLKAVTYSLENRLIDCVYRTEQKDKCNLLEYLTQRDIQTKNSGVNVRYRGKHRFFKGFNEFIKEKTRRCDNDFEKIERHVFF